jgi:hypothetical protein
MNELVGELGGAITFTDSANFTAPDITDEMVALAEERLGVRLPASYVRLLRIQNGGEPVRHCYPMPFPTSWAEDHIDVGAILGIGGTRGIDAEVGGSNYMIAEWGYPPIGVVICDTPSGGDDTVMLDYSSSGPEPAVVYVDEDRVPQRIADTFDEFLAKLIKCPTA